MTIIEVMVIMVDENGREHTYWGGEVGTAEFYVVHDTLEAYLGKNVQIHNHGVNDTFIIKTYDEIPSNISHYIEIIKVINDNTYSFESKEYIRFEILNVEY